MRDYWHFILPLFFCRYVEYYIDMSGYSLCRHYKRCVDHSTNKYTVMSYPLLIWVKVQLVITQFFTFLWKTKIKKNIFLWSKTTNLSHLWGKISNMIFFSLQSSLGYKDGEVTVLYAHLLNPGIKISLYLLPDWIGPGAQDVTAAHVVVFYHFSLGDDLYGDDNWWKFRSFIMWCLYKLYYLDFCSFKHKP